MSCLTKLFRHTGTTSPTDIGPATSGVLHSILIDTRFGGGGGSVTIRDGGSGGTIIFKGIGDHGWNGVRLSGQLNIELPDAATIVTVEMSELL